MRRLSFASVSLVAVALVTGIGCQSLPDDIDPQDPVGSAIEKAYANYGGRNAYLALSGLRQESRVILWDATGSRREGRFLLEFSAPDRLRIEVTSPDGRELIQVHENGVAREWNEGEETGREILPELKRRLDYMFILTLFDSPDHRPRLAGTLLVAGKECMALEVDKDESVYTLYLDVETWLIRRLREVITRDDESIVNDVFMEDYRTVQERPIAWRFITLQNHEKTQEARMLDVQVDPTFPEARFRER